MAAKNEILLYTIVNHFHLLNTQDERLKISMANDQSSALYFIKTNNIVPENENLYRLLNDFQHLPVELNK